MQKQQQKQGHTRACQSCLKETTNELFMTDVANYSEESNNLTMVSKYLCKPCRDQISSIRSFVEENGLNFGKETTLGKLLLKQLGERVAIERKSRGKFKDKCMSSQLYSQTISQQIRRVTLDYNRSKSSIIVQKCHIMPSSYSITQRHQSIRNLINQILEIVPVPLDNLYDIVTLVNVLMCFLQEPGVIAVVRDVGEKWVIQGEPQSNQHKDSKEGKDNKEGKADMEENGDNLWRKLCNGGYIGNITILITALIRNWPNFPVSYHKIRTHQSYIKPSQLPQLLPQSIPHASPPASSISSSSSPTCKQCQRNKIQQHLSQARYKNVLSLILATAVKEDAIHREHVMQIQAKFMREKDQFINKIIKLKDKIEVMETETGSQGFGFRRARSVSECHFKSVVKGELDVVSEKSQGTSKTVQIKEKNDQNVKTLETEKQKQQDGNALAYLQQLLSNLPEFQPSLLSSDADPRTLTDTIQTSIKSLSSQVQALSQKNRILQAQSKRLLSILTRKQQRFVPLIHEKDEIIQKYENALWRMEHGLIVEDPALAPRIENIINVFKNQFMESLSNGTLDFDERVSQKKIEELTPVKGNTSGKKKTKEKQKTRVNKTQGKVKSDDKECVIF